jgi:hypothetical protein
VLTPGTYELSCYLHGHRPNLAVTIEFDAQGGAPFVPMPSGSYGTYDLAAGTIPPVILTPQNSDILVTVQSATS